jgi:SprB repeat/Secretion system C-terminal sorting domain
MPLTLKIAINYNFMKIARLKLILCCCFLINTCISLLGQTTGFHIENVSTAGGEGIQIDVTTSNFDTIIAFNFTVAWDANVLTYETVGNFNPQLPDYNSSNFNVPGGAQNNLFTLWDDAINPTDLEDGAVLFTIFFSSSCSETGSTPVIFNTTYTYEAGTNSGAFTPIITNGSITFTAQLNVSNTTSTPVSCFGGSNGCAQVIPTNGATPYTYLWSNGGTTAQICGLVPGTYTCTVTDAGDCTKVTNPITISAPTALSLCQNTLTPPSCTNGNNGCILLSACGGTPSYTYNWSNGGTTNQICNLTAGSYTCTVTDANGCTSSMSYTLSNPANPVTIQNASTTNASCSGGGSINLTISGGNTPYSFLWSNNATTEDISNLSAGTYNCTITDDEGCTVVSPIYTITLIGNNMSSSNVVTPVSCFGGNNGAINLTLNGGAAPITYLWSNNATTQDISNLTSGTYSCTITDANSCTLVASNILVSGPASAVAINSINKVNVLCFGQSTGSIGLEIGGGTSPYSYAWSNGATASGISNLASGSYSCVITDTNGCTISTGNIAISQPSAAISISNISIDDVNCFNGADGSISFSTNGGTPLYTYLWNNGSTSSSLSSVPAGNYRCTITDANACTFVSAWLEVEVPTAITIQSNTITNASCSDGGEIALTVGGGISPYSYNWSNGQTGNPLSDVNAGNYVCTITDANGCTLISPSYSVILADSDLTLTNSIIDDVDCFGGNTGSISLIMSGANTPFQYLWNTNATTASINNLIAGSYSCTVTDASGCSVVASGLLVPQPAAQLAISNITQNNVLCQGGSNGSASVSATGGTPTYSYLWNTGATGATISNLQAGVYSCTITDSKNCQVPSNNITITQPSTSVSFTNLVITDLSCNGSDDGSISLSGTGGASPYSYLWNNSATTALISNLDEGSYLCTITDNNGCTVVTNIFEVESPSAINLTNFIIDNATCSAGGSIALTVGGGTGSFNYNWSSGATGATLMNANAGVYNCTVTDAAGCTFVTQSFTILLEDSDLNLNSFNAVHITCFGLANGAININVSGTGTPFGFNWNNGATTQNISNLASGNYTCTITDVNGCSVVSSTITITQPAAPLAINNVTSNNLTCANANNGSITLTVSGGTPPYTYNWITGGNSSTISNLPSGTYNCTITDNNGCTLVSPSVTITSPSAISITNALLTDASCGQADNGSIDISVSGGQSPYTYLWNNGATTQDLNSISSGIYNCVITDNNGCNISSPGYLIANTGSDLSVSSNNTIPVSCFGGSNGAINLTVSGTSTPFVFQWSNGATTQNINNLPSGLYSCTVTDASNCSTTIASIQISQPAAALNISNSSHTNVSCNGAIDGSITIQASGGTIPYTYLWNNQATGSTLNNLPPGNYNCDITDANGCTVESATISISEPATLVLAVVSTVNVICGQGNNGSIDINITGGTIPYAYQWSNGATSQDLNALMAGNYTCTITDNNNCSIVSNPILIDDEGSDIEVTMEEVNHVNCFGENSGSIALTLSGSATPFSYLWNNGATTATVSNLTAGTYNCIITDANGCITSSSNITITQPTQPLTLADSDLTNSACVGTLSGSISITIEGGTAPYSYNWNNGASSANITMLPVGSYTCTVSDANQCSFIVGPLVINNPVPLSLASSNINNAGCTIGGAIEIEITGGSGSYSYEWNYGSNDQSLLNIPAGVYICTVTDSDGCTFVTEEFVVLNTSTDLSWMATSRQQITCFGDNNGMINISVSGSAIPFTYNWSNGATTEDIDNLSPGLYSCTITDALGCNITLSNLAITEPESPLFELDNQGNNPLCANSNDGSILLTIIGGINPYNYLWNNGEITNNPQGLGAGDYTCTITDFNGCELVSSTTTLSTPPPVVLNNATVENEMNGDNSGSVSIDVSGGTGLLSYLWNNTATTSMISGLTIGDYFCTVSDAVGCSEVFGPFVIDNVVATIEVTESDVRIYPNPAQSEVFIESYLAIQKVRLLDIRGGAYAYQSINAFNSKIVIEALPDGIYILEVIFENGLKAHKKLITAE